MTYLILQILFCLIIAFIIGFILGWLLGRASCKKNQITQPYVPQPHRVKDSTPVPMPKPTPVKTETATAKVQNFQSGRDTTRSYAPPPPIAAKPVERVSVKQVTPPPPPPAPAPVKPKAVEPVRVVPTPVAPAAKPVSFAEFEAHLSTKGYEIETLEGVGPKTGESLREIGIATISDFLKQANLKSRRSEIASEISVRPKMVDSWASMSDLLRIKGLDHQAAELIHKSGVNTVTDLSTKSVSSFRAKMNEVNVAGKRRIAPEVPEDNHIADWIGQAAKMKSAIEV